MFAKHNLKLILSYYYGISHLFIMLFFKLYQIREDKEKAEETNSMIIRIVFLFKKYILFSYLEFILE